MHLLEDKLDPELRSAWQWRPWQQIKQDTSRPDKPNVRFVGETSRVSG